MSGRVENFCTYICTPLSMLMILLSYQKVQPIYKTHSQWNTSANVERKTKAMIFCKRKGRQQYEFKLLQLLSHIHI